MKKIIHLSDLHVGCKEDDSTVSLTDRFNDTIDYLRTEVESPKDHIVVVTGDIVHNAKQTDFQLAKDSFDLLEKKYGYTVLVVPGNHDYRVKENISGEIISSEEAKEQFCNVFYGGDLQFPKRTIVGSTTANGQSVNIAFLGVDSNADKLEGSKGKIGEEQLIELDERLNSEEIKQCDVKVVYLHHNPFYHKIWSRWAMGLIDRADFVNLMRRHRVSLLLYGHTHSHSFKINKKNIALCLDGGTTTGRGKNDTPARIIDFLTIDYDDIEEFEKEDIETHFEYISESWR